MFGRKKKYQEEKNSKIVGVVIHIAFSFWKSDSNPVFPKVNS